MTRTIRLNEGVDPRMIGVEYADAKKGNHMKPPRVRWLQHELASADTLVRLGTRIAIRMPRRVDPAA